MNETAAQSLELKTNETVTPLMVYTSHGLLWGKMPHNENILATRVLIGVTTPEFISLHEANYIKIESNYITKPTAHKHILVPTHSILGYHLTPPHRDQLDYDETEPHRKMTPVKFYFGALQASALMRIAEISNVRSTLEVIKANYIAFYDLEISHPNNPKMAPIKTNMGYFQIESILVAE